MKQNIIPLPRECVEKRKSDASIQPLPIQEFSNRRAYVLLGEPGSGKSTVFLQEAATENAMGQGLRISASDFINLPIDDEWRSKVLFIDGLDEMRAGGVDGRQPLNAIKGRLAELGNPPFRLSCREADWFGDSDANRLTSLYGEDALFILHLQDLSESSADELLRHLGVSDIQLFRTKAKIQGLHDFLRTPLNIELLVSATNKGQDWPENRQQTFQFAVSALVKEPNDDHQDAQRGKEIGETDLLDTAGELCAMHLIAHTDGYSFSQDFANPKLPYIGDLTIPITDAMQLVLRRRIFISDETENFRRPFHRTIAEYLAAVYLTKKIAAKELLATRAVAMLSAGDGTIVNSLRGLAAWLGALSLECRLALLDRDPIGMLIYGDAHQFSDDWIIRILKAIERNVMASPGMRFMDTESPALAGLIRPGLFDTLNHYLSLTSANEGEEVVQYLILTGLKYSSPVAVFLPALEEMVRNEGRLKYLRAIAMQNWLNAQSDASAIFSMLDEINFCHIPDIDNELLGIMLKHVFPTLLGGADLAKYLRVQTHSYSSGTYSWFWEHDLFEKGATEDIQALLDAMAAKKYKLTHHIDCFHTRRFLGQLLAVGLETLRNNLAPDRLRGWLEIGRDGEFSATIEEEFQSRIRAWLQKNPEHYKALLKLIVAENQCDSNFQIAMGKSEGVLYGAPRPLDFAEWCLKHAESESNAVAAEYFFEQACAAPIVSGGQWEDFPIAEFATWVQRHPRFQGLWEKFTYCDWPEWRKTRSSKQREYQVREKNQRDEWIEGVIQQLPQLEAGNAPAGLMAQLAGIFEGHFVDVHGETPMERFENFFTNHKYAIGIIFSALFGAIHRQDVPSFRDIITSDSKNKYFLLRQPYLIALNHLADTGVRELTQLSDEQLASGFAFRLTYEVGNTPTWFRYIIWYKTGVASEVFIDYAKPALKSAREHIAGLYALGHDPDYAPLARNVALPLLEAVPIKLGKGPTGHIASLLYAALRYQLEGLLPFIQSRLHRKTLDNSQKVLLLATAALVSPDEYGERLSEFIGSSETRAATLSGFLGNRDGVLTNSKTLPVKLLERFIRVLGPRYAEHRRTGLVTPEMRGGDNVYSLINQLAQHTGDEAKNALRRLVETKSLSHWKNQLEYAIESQRGVTREASFQPPTIAAIATALHNGRPASPEELRVWIEALIRNIGCSQLRGDTNGYLRCWNSDHPQYENDCRDYLLELLRPMLLGFGIEALPEGQFFDHKRADIRISLNSGQWILPIEIKRNSHQEVWRALKKQLMTHYTPDAAAFGQGIYLVFWFGKDFTKTAPFPETAAEMEKLLFDSLSLDEQRSLSVIVLDVSRPEKPAKPEKHARNRQPTA